MKPNWNEGRRSESVGVKSFIVFVMFLWVISAKTNARDFGMNRWIKDEKEKELFEMRFLVSPNFKWQIKRFVYIPHVSVLFPLSWQMCVCCFAMFFYRCAWVQWKNGPMSIRILECIRIMIKWVLLLTVRYWTGVDYSFIWWNNDEKYTVW